MNTKVDDYFIDAKSWQNELAQLRAILLDCGLSETWKWRNPCYEFQQNNIVMLSSLKECCVVSFFKGALLADTEGLLIQQTENMQALRQLRFSSVAAILALENTLKNYIYEAMEVEKSGLKVEYKKVSDFEIPEELEHEFASNVAFKTAFEALTPGRQKGYILHFAAPKQAKTRASRIEQSMSRILDGKGINDCTCGLSKKMPACDGSHKYIGCEIS